MQIDFPDDILILAAAGASDIRLAAALQLYADNRIDHADACRLAGLDAQAFNREAVQRGLSIQQYQKTAGRRRAG